MNIPNEFDDIRPYCEEELPEAFERLLADEQFQGLVKLLFPQITLDIVRAKMQQCKSGRDFEKVFVYDFITSIIQQHADGVDFDCSRLPDRQAHYTFISNHRDIVVDPALLCYGLLDEHMNTVEIAIGDNLLAREWIETLVRICKAFVVKRGLGLREQLQASVQLSRYIHFSATKKHENIWIAQRQGRAKDSNDRTQDSVLKMLAMGGEGTPVENLRQLNLVPLSLSYEYDPCDYLKAKEAQQKRDNSDFRKSPQDDLLSMQTGIFGYKGHIHFQTSCCLNDELDEIDKLHLPKTELFGFIAKRIDRHIHQNYRIYPCNRVALDMLEGKSTGTYSAEEKDRFEQYLQLQIDKIELPNKDIPFLRERILEMYANPLKNHLEAIQ